MKDAQIEQARTNREVRDARIDYLLELRIPLAETPVT